MRLGDILVCMDGSDTGRRRTDRALEIAQRAKARVVGYQLLRSGGPIVETAVDRPLADDIEAAADEFSRKLEQTGLEGAFVSGTRDHSVADIARHARTVDLIVAGLGIPDDPRSDPQGIDFDQLVLECGRPVLGLPIVDRPGRLGDRAMVAWDGSREAARALHDALPFLQEASSVTVVAIDIDRTSPLSPDKVAEHLGRHGVRATIDASFDMKLPIGEEILSRVEREEIDLLVAGAFGHSRVRERLFGGASRTLLHQMMVPVLASH